MLYIFLLVQSILVSVLIGVNMFEQTFGFMDTCNGQLISSVLLGLFKWFNIINLSNEHTLHLSLFPWFSFRVYLPANG